MRPLFAYVGREASVIWQTVSAVLTLATSRATAKRFPQTGPFSQQFPSVCVAASRSRRSSSRTNKEKRSLRFAGCCHPRRQVTPYIIRSMNNGRLMKAILFAVLTTLAGSASAAVNIIQMRVTDQGLASRMIAGAFYIP